LFVNEPLVESGAYVVMFVEKSSFAGHREFEKIAIGDPNVTATP
jgi:hypothetical protein